MVCYKKVFLSSWSKSQNKCSLINKNIDKLEGHLGLILSVCMSSEGSRIISGSLDKTIKIWDTITGCCVNTLEGHFAPISSVCVSSDGSRIVSGSQDNTVKIWDATTTSTRCVISIMGDNYS